VIHLTFFSGRNSQTIASFCCHAGIEFLQGNMLKIEKECKFLHGPENEKAELLVTFIASIKFKQLLSSTAKSKNVSSSGELSSAIIDESPPISAPWFSSVSTSPLKGRFLVTDHRMSVSSAFATYACSVPDNHFLPDSFLKRAQSFRMRLCKSCREGCRVLTNLNFISVPQGLLLIIVLCHQYTAWILL
jgi:hypothetical protein